MSLACMASLAIARDLAPAGQPLKSPAMGSTGADFPPPAPPNGLSYPQSEMRLFTDEGVEVVGASLPG